MAELKYLLVEDNLESYYITLCDVYFYNYSEDNTEKEKTKLAGTIDTLSILIFHSINIEGTTIRDMDKQKYEHEYKRFYEEMMLAISECSKNQVDIDDFLEIMDEIVGAAIMLKTAFDKLKKVKEEEPEEDYGEEDEE
jgi:hypothetical protein